MTGYKFWESKTKLGALLVGLSALLGTLGGYFTGSIDMSSTIQALVIEVGGVIAVFGLRDIPLLNKVK